MYVAAIRRVSRYLPALFRLSHLSAIREAMSGLCLHLLCGPTEASPRFVILASDLFQNGSDVCRFCDRSFD